MKHRHLIVVLSIWATKAFASLDSIGPDGIDSISTRLTGAGIDIGQGEPYRSGKAGYDSASLSVSNTIPTGVYREGFPGMDVVDSFFLGDHATEVAEMLRRL